jgi:hypothetical protein
MEKILSIIFLLIAFTGNAHAGGYRCEKVASIGLAGELVIADGRNDGLNRLYVPTYRFHEIYWNGAGWVNDSLFYDKLGSFWCTSVSFGRNDSICRVYAGNSSGYLWEFSFNGSFWDSIKIDYRKWASLTNIKIGNIKNDDTMRLVVSGYDSSTIAYTYDKDSCIWRKETILRSFPYINSLALGQGKNNSVERIYLGNLLRTFEASDSSLWSIDTIEVNLGVTPFGLVLGQVRDDGINRIYVDGNYECLWTGTDWDCQAIDTINGCSGVSGIGAGRNDGVNRLYTATSLNEEIDSTYANVYIREKSFYPDSGWKVKNIPIVIVDPWWNLMRNEMLYVTVGDLRNDGIQRVYGACSNGEIFECTWDDTLNGVAGEPPTDSAKHIALKLEQNYPNPFKDRTTINYQLTTNGSVNLSVYNIAGQLVRDLTPSPLQMNFERGMREGSVTWDGRDSHGKPVMSGLYFYCLEAGGTRRTKKMILLK